MKSLLSPREQLVYCDAKTDELLRRGKAPATFYQHHDYEAGLDERYVRCRWCERVATREEVRDA